MLWMELVVGAAWLVQLVVCYSHHHQRQRPWGYQRFVLDRRKILLLHFASKAKEEEDWRAFRAKLVLNETTSTTTSSSITRVEHASHSSSSPLSSWAYVAGLMVEKGSLVISRVESALGCHDLRQPYFAKCVILILQHDEEFTQGIILNRPSNLVLKDDEDILYLNDTGNILLPWGDDDDRRNNEANKYSWRMFFGGDIAGLYDDNPVIVCLHNLTSEAAQRVSDAILPGVYLTSHLAARGLLDTGAANTTDSFFTFYGFCGWDPGQLETEVQRGSWYVVATDPRTLWNQLETMRDLDYDPRSVGLNMWSSILDMVGKGNETGDRDTFADLMLKEWATESLVMKKRDNTESGELDDSDIFRALQAADRPRVRAGSLLCASHQEVSPFLLHDQFLHKSTILVLQDTESFSLGLILNLPTSDIYTLELTDGRISNFTIRYGGPSADEEEKEEADGNDEEDEEQLIWLHCSMGLKYLRIGKPLAPGDDIGVWICTRDQVKQAIDCGFAAQDEFLLVKGFCVWEKEEGSGGILGQVMSGKLEPIPTGNIDAIWTTLLKQGYLCEHSLSSNFELALTAWNLGRNDENKRISNSRYVFDTTVKVDSLADDALFAWIKIFLLDTSN